MIRPRLARSHYSEGKSERENYMSSKQLNGWWHRPSCWVFEARPWAQIMGQIDSDLPHHLPGCGNGPVNVLIRMRHAGEACLKRGRRQVDA